MQRGKESPTNFSLSSGQGHRHSRRFDSRRRPMQRGKESPTNFSLSSGQGHRQTSVCRLGKGIDIHAGSTRGGGRCNAVKKVRQTSVCRLGKGIDIHAGSTRGGGRCNAVKKVRQTSVCRLGKGIAMHAVSTRGGGRCNAVKKVRQTSVCRLGKGIDKLKFVGRDPSFGRFRDPCYHEATSGLIRGRKRTSERQGGR